MEVERARKAKELLEDLADVDTVMRTIHNSPFKLIVGNKRVTLTPDLREAVRNAFHDYKESKTKKLIEL